MMSVPSSPSFYRLGLLGYPVAHSLSPRLHQAALAALGLAGEYRLYPVPPPGEAALRRWIARLREGALHGLNVTLPHKARVAALCDRLTPAAAAIGAVNTLYRARDGAVVGDNTDAPGFLYDLFAHFPHLAARAGWALVLGGGGAAQAVVYALAQRGWRVSVATRRPEQAAALQRLTAALPGQVHPVPWAERGGPGGDPGPDLVVNATPLGMHPDPSSSPWPDEAPLPPQAAVYDLVYNPRPTRLVQRARAQGRPAADGLGMLVAQAALAFARWVEVTPPFAVMAAAVGYAFPRQAA